MKAGKYIVTLRSRESGLNGPFMGSANLLWDDGDTTCELAIHYHKGLPTTEEAEQHALNQVELRVRDGKL